MKNQGNNWLNIQKPGPGNKPRWKQGCPKSEWSCTDELEKKQKSLLRASADEAQSAFPAPLGLSIPQRDWDPLNPSLTVSSYIASKVKGPVDTPTCTAYTYTYSPVRLYSRSSQVCFTLRLIFNFPWEKKRKENTFEKLAKIRRLGNAGAIITAPSQKRSN